MDKKVEILLFEDNPGDANLIGELLENFVDFPFELTNVETLNEGLNLLKERPFDVILSDLGLPDSNGVDTFLDIHVRNSRIPIIILTGMDDEKIGIEAVKKGAQDYLVKGQVDGRLLDRSIRYSIERKKAEDKIQNLANVVESSDDAIMTGSLNGIITSWNKGAEQIYGYSAGEILGKHISILTPPLLVEETKKLVEMIKQGERVRHYETSRLRKDSMIINVSITLSPVFDGSEKLIAISIISRDITERKKAEESLNKMEKIRKKEIHHRIKNNLQVISSLLDLQAEHFDDEKVKQAFRESQKRVVSMALIHEELYESGEVGNLNFVTYLQKLVKYIFRCYNIGDSEVHLLLKLEEKTFFDMDTAVPLGIIVNELVSNSLKHAFPGREGGVIRIELSREEEREWKNNGAGSKKGNCMSTNFVLTVSDNGVGIHESFNLENSDTLGIQLVVILVDQLDGELELKRDCGTEFIIKIAVKEKL